MADSKGVSADPDAAEHHEIWRTLVWPAASLGAVPQHRPVAVWVCGQPGSGKSTLAAQVSAALRRRGTAVLVGADRFKRYHPGYNTFLEQDDLTAGRQVRAAVQGWQR